MAVVVVPGSVVMVCVPKLKNENENLHAQISANNTMRHVDVLSYKQIQSLWVTTCKMGFSDFINTNHNH